MAALRSQQGAGAEQRAEQQQQAEMMRQSMLLQILEPEARERLSRIALVKPQTARQVEDAIIQNARSGRLTSKINEATLKNLLSQFSEQSSAPKVTITRKKYNADYDDDDDVDYKL
eukprot:TRINITY_DN5452_c0_g1_i2.p1 TRINITY_DN5452_c0_g1~~TRINITY_DN5452_c0_g1_i2.p1  ORF type:complete len:116 (+),score=35.43 TRINITY_DN5452_c0_g1_i2:36-383(+)